MEIYCVGGLGAIKHYNTDLGLEKILVSFVDLNNRNVRHYLDTITKFRSMSSSNKIFLDSGAYTAWTQGRRINLLDYIKFIKSYGHYFDRIASLDDMDDWQKSLDNYRDMVKAGLAHVMPVYHLNEPFQVIDDYFQINPNIDYLGLGRLVAEKTSLDTLDNKLITIFNYLRSLDNIPKDLKVHLFGITNYRILSHFLTRVNSADSSAWLSAAMYGQLSFAHRNMQFNFKKITKNRPDMNISKIVTARWLCYNVIQIRRTEETLTRMQEQEQYKFTNSPSIVVNKE